MLLDFIIGVIFFGYIFYNGSMIILLAKNDVEMPVWKQVLYFFFGVFIEGIDNIRTAFRK